MNDAEIDEKQVLVITIHAWKMEHFVGERVLRLGTETKVYNFEKEPNKWIFCL